MGVIKEEVGGLFMERVLAHKHGTILDLNIINLSNDMHYQCKTVGRVLRKLLGYDIFRWGKQRMAGWYVFINAGILTVIQAQLTSCLMYGAIANFWNAHEFSEEVINPYL